LRCTLEGTHHTGCECYEAHRDAEFAVLWSVAIAARQMLHWLAAAIEWRSVLGEPKQIKRWRAAVEAFEALDKWRQAPEEKP
jgi:hypothetical protein